MQSQVQFKHDCKGNKGLKMKNDEQAGVKNAILANTPAMDTPRSIYVSAKCGRRSLHWATHLVNLKEEGSLVYFPRSDITYQNIFC